MKDKDYVPEKEEEDYEADSSGNVKVIFLSKKICSFFAIQ